MKIIFDLNKSAMTGKVQVQRTVTRGGTTFQQHFWVNPSDVKDTDVVIGGSQNSLEISEKNFPVGSKIYYKGEEATVQRVGREFSGGGMGIVVRFSKGGTGTIGKSDMKNVSKTPPSKPSQSSSDMTQEKFNKKYPNGGMQDPEECLRHNGSNATWHGEKLQNPSVMKRAKEEYKQFQEDKKALEQYKKNSTSKDDKGRTLNRHGKPVTDALSPANIQPKAPKGFSDKVTNKPDKAVGKNWSETKTELGKMGYKVDSIFSSNPPQPKEKLTLYKDGKTYEAEVTKYSNGDYEILGSSIKEVKKDGTKTDDKSPVVTNFKNGFVRYSPDGEKPPYHGGKSYKYFASRKDDVKGKYFDTKEEAEDYVNGNNVKPVSGKNVKFNSVSSGRWESDKQVIDAAMIKPNGDPVSSKSSKYVILKDGDKYKLYEVGLNRKQHIKSTGSLDEAVKAADALEDKTKDTKSKQDNSASGSKFDASEFTKLKSDRPKALQYLKDKGITWKETDNEGINWMRACMSASKASNSDASTTKKDSAGKSSPDNKTAGNSSYNAKKAIADLLASHGNDRTKVMQAAKDSGVTWKESDHAGINWMRASLAIQKHQESGKTIGASKSDDSTKADDKKDTTSSTPAKVTISDLKRPTSNGTSTELKAGDYKITITKQRNVGTNAKQHPSVYHISVDKDGDNVFRTDKTDWKDIKYHAQRYIDSASNSDTQTDNKSNSTSSVKQLKPTNLSTRDEFDIHSKVKKGELSKTPIGDSDKEMIKNLVPNHKSVLKESDTRCVAYSKNREYRFTKLSDSHFKCEVYETSNKKDTSKPIKTSWYETK